MPLSDVTFAIDQHSPGLSPDQITGLPMMTGVCSKGVAKTIYALGPDSDLDTLIGVGPLRDALDDHFKEVSGAKLPYVLAVPVDASGTGTVGTPVVTKTGEAAATFGAACLMDAEVLIECTKAGASGVAQVRISLDNGETWDLVGQVVTTAVDIGIPLVGLTCTFNFNSGEMDLGDAWSVKTTAAGGLLVDVLEVIESARDTGYWPEFYVIPMTTDADDWASLGAEADYLVGQKQAAWFLAQAAPPTTRSAADLNTWANSLVAESADFSHAWVSVCAAYGRVAERSGRKRYRMLTGKASGILARSQVNESLGWRGKNAMSDVTPPDAYTNALATSLVHARYLALVRRQKPRACCFNNAPTMAVTNSKFNRVEAVRTTFKAIRLVEQAIEPYIESPGWERAGMQGKPSKEKIGVEAIVSAARDNLSTMLTAQPLSELDGFKITAPASGQSLAGPNGLYLKLELFGIPNIAHIHVGVAFDFAGWNVELVEVA